MLDRKKARKSTEKSFILSIPKRIIRLSTERNRIRRLIREAMRLGAFRSESAKIYYFQVHQQPTAPGLKEVQETVQTIIHGIQ